MIEVAKNITLSGERILSILKDADMYYQVIENNVDSCDGKFVYFKLIIQSTETDQYYATELRWCGGDLIDPVKIYQFHAVKKVKKSVIKYVDL